MKSFQGLSLIELMLSLFISLILFLYLFMMYMTASKSNDLLNQHLRMEENAETAATILRKAVKKAGYIGCAKWVENFPIANHTTILFSAKNKITKTRNTITFQYMDPKGSTLIKTMQGLSTLYSTTNVNFSPQDILLVSDCKSADIFVANKIINEEGMQKIISSSPLSKRYGPDAVVALLEINQFFIQNTRRKYSNGQWVPALYVKNIKNRKLELVEGINAMRFQFNSHNKVIAGISFSLSLKEETQKKGWNFYAALQN